MDIALASKNRDTARSRMALAEQILAECSDRDADLMTPATTAAIKDLVEFEQRTFHTDVYLNEARTHRAKAAELKTAKARTKHRQRAQEIIAEGLNDPRSDKDALNAFLGTLPDH